MGKKSRGKKTPPPGKVPLGNLPGGHLDVQRTRAMVNKLAKNSETVVNAAEFGHQQRDLYPLPPGFTATKNLGVAGGRTVGNGEGAVLPADIEVPPGLVRRTRPPGSIPGQLVLNTRRNDGEPGAVDGILPGDILAKEQPLGFFDSGVALPLNREYEPGTKVWRADPAQAAALDEQAALRGFSLEAAARLAQPVVRESRGKRTGSQVIQAKVRQPHSRREERIKQGRRGSVVPLSLAIPVTRTTPATVPLATATEVLDTHAALAGFMKSPTPGLVDYMESFMESVYARAKAESGDVGLAQAWAYLFSPAQKPLEFLNFIGKQLADATTYQVTKRMVAEVTATYTKSLPYVDRMDVGEVPAEAGFVWFDAPAEFTDIQGKTMSHRAMSWGVQNVVAGGGRLDTIPGLRITTWCHSDDIDDYWGSDIRQDLFDIGGRSSKLTLAHSVVVPFGQRFLNRLEEQPAEPSGDDIARWLHTLFMYLNAEITVSTPAPVSRTVRRRSMRSLKHGQVNVITLRRIRNLADPSGQHRYVEWSCRWVVQAHWRHIGSYTEDRHHAVPARGDRLVPGEDMDHDHCLRCGVRITWVRATIKGPTWLPLKADRQLYKLRR